MKYLILHHSLLSGVIKQAPVIEAYHKEKFGMLSSLNKYTCYNYVIEKNGETIKCREDGTEGCHTIGYNKDIGVCLALDSYKESPTKAQIDAVIELKRKYNLPIKFHREVQEYRTCPGPINKAIFDPPILLTIPNEEIKKAENIKKQISVLNEIVNRLRLILALVLKK